MPSYFNRHWFLQPRILWAIAVGGLVVATALAIYAGSKVFLIRGEDTFRHFANGGTFASGQPSPNYNCTRLWYASPETGQGDIYELDVTSGKRLRITSSPECDTSPKLLERSKRILFVRETNGRRHIWSMAVDGSKQVQLTSGNVIDDIFAVSSNEKLVFVLRSASTFGGGRTVSGYLLDITDPKKELLEIGLNGSFSPIGDAIIYNPPMAINEVWIRNLRSGDAKRIGFGTGPQMSPNQDSVLVYRHPTVADAEENLDIVILDLMTGKERRIGQGHSASFLPDGSGVVFYQNYSNDFRVITTAGGKITDLDLPSGPRTPPTFCRDGSTCAVATLPSGPANTSNSSSQDLFLIRVGDWTVMRLNLTPVN